MALGAASISAQIILLRELLSAFYGNELSIGIILASWLLLVSVGSILSGKISDKIINKLEVFAAISILLALLIPAALFLSRAMKHIMGFMPGEIIGLGPAFCLSLASLSLFCLPYGFLFPLGARVISQFHADKAKSPVSAYFCEAAGTVIGGSLTSLALIKILMPFDIAFIMSLFVLMAALSVSRHITSRKAVILKYIAVFFLALNIASWPLGIPGRIERLSERIMWQPFDLIKTENSIYGAIAAISEKDQLSFYTSGGFAFAFPDTLGAEETVHYPLALHPNPRNILLIGGGLNGALDELYKCDPDTVDYVELDPALIEMAKDVIGKEMRRQLSNPTLQIYKGDGRFYIKTTHKKYDVIILAVPAPRTIQVNRFYTKEFFTEAKKVLRENGILSLTCEGGENYIGPELAEYLGIIYGTLRIAGFDVRIIPGENIKFIASKGGTAKIDVKSLQKTLDTRGIKTTFVRDYYLENNLAPERIEYAERIIRGVKKLRVNTDFKPISYYYDMILWTTSFQSVFNTPLKALNEKILWYLIGIAYFIIISFGIKKRKAIHRPVIIAVAATGFAQITIELSIMLAFQALYGYLYYKLGLIVTLFMAGLFAGSFITVRRTGYIKNASSSLKKSKIALGLFSFFLIPIFKILSNYTHFYRVNAGALFIFPALIFITGALGGAQFALASKIITKEGLEVGRTSGVLYGADLMGGVVGALLLAAIFVPILGIFQCLIAVGILNLASALIIPTRTAQVRSIL